MRIIKGNIFTVFVAVILKIGSLNRNKATIYAVLYANLLSRYEVAFIFNYFVINVAAVSGLYSLYHNLLRFKGLEWKTSGMDEWLLHCCATEPNKFEQW